MEDKAARIRNANALARQRQQDSRSYKTPVVLMPLVSHFE